jgi:ribosome maturation factor RimP
LADGREVEYKAKKTDEITAAIIRELQPVVNGLGFALVELSVFRRKTDAQVKLVITKPPGDNKDCSAGISIDSRRFIKNQAWFISGVGTEELSKVHRSVLPRLELALSGKDLYVEVSSPGTGRIIKEGAEFCHFIGRDVKCWLKNSDDWKQGVLLAADEAKISLEMAEGVQEIKYETIAKAKLGN